VPRRTRSRSRARTAPPAPHRTPPQRRTAAGRLRRWVHRRPLVVAAALVGLHLALAYAVFQPAPHPGGDNAVYLTLGRGLVEGGGYRDLWDPAAPRHVQFPPGFPAIVAAALAAGVQPWAGLKWIVVGFSAAAVALTFFWLRRSRRPLAAVGVTLLVAVSPGVLTLSHAELSDVPFWALLTASLLAWERAPRRAHGRAAAGSLAAAAAYLVRSAGMALFAATAAWLVLRRRWRQAAIFAAAALPVWAAWAFGSAGLSSYANAAALRNPYDPSEGKLRAGDVLPRVWDNVGVYADRHLPELLVGGHGRILLPLTVAVVVLAVYGWASRLRRPGFAEVLMPVYLGMLLVWPWEWSGTRLLLPVYPLLLAYAGDGLWRAARETRGRVPARAAGIAAVALVALVALPAVARDTRHAARCRADHRAGDAYACELPARRDFYRLAEAAGQILPDGAVVLNRKPALFHAISGHAGRVFPFHRDPDAFLRAAREAGARYVVLDYTDALGHQYLTPILMRRPGAFCGIHSLGASRATLLGILPDAESAPDAGADPGAADQTVGFSRCPPDYVRPEGE
jgi:hypothetical protein